MRKYEYLVEWKNYEGHEYNTWEIEEGLSGASDLIKQFDLDLSLKKSYTADNKMC